MVCVVHGLSHAPPHSLRPGLGCFWGALGRQGLRKVIIWNPLLESWGEKGEEEGWFPPCSAGVGRHICMHIWLLETSGTGMPQSE